MSSRPPRNANIFYALSVYPTLFLFTETEKKEKLELEWLQSFIHHIQTGVLDTVATSITSNSKSISGMAKTEEHTIEKCNSYVYGEDPEFVRLFQRKATKEKSQAKNIKSATSTIQLGQLALFFGEQILI